MTTAPKEDACSVCVALGYACSPEHLRGSGRKTSKGKSSKGCPHLKKVPAKQLPREYWVCSDCNAVGFSRNPPAFDPKAEYAHALDWAQARSELATPAMREEFARAWSAHGALYLPLEAAMRVWLDGYTKGGV